MATKPNKAHAIVAAIVGANMADFYIADALVNVMIGKKPSGASNFSAYNVSDDMPAQSTCDKCKRPRDNLHPTLCPICILSTTYTLKEQNGQAERPTPA